MKEKSDITRYMMKRNILRNIIFRVDYKGIVKLEDFISDISELLLKPHFEEYNNTYNNNINIDSSRTSIEDVSKMLSIPVKEVSQQEIHIYSKSKFTNKETMTTDDVVLQIGKYFITLEVKCKGEYVNIDPYLSYFSDIIQALQSHNNYIRFKRIGLRKIASQLFSNRKEVYTIFEQDKYGDVLDDKYIPLEFNRIDVVNNPNRQYVYNYKRTLKSVQVVNRNTGEKSDGYLAMIDLDGYISEDDIDYRHFIISKCLEEMNEDLFVLFKNAVTTDFLNENLSENE